MSLNNIFARPEVVDGIVLYPVSLENYDEFASCSRFLYLSKDNFGETPYSLMELMISVYENLGETFDSHLTKICKTFEIVTKGQVGFVSNPDMPYFSVGDNIISEVNYDNIRDVIMKQNLIFTPKKYEDQIVQEWVDKALAVRNRKNKMTIEDMITTVKSYQGISYSEIEKQSIYQLYADFYRICKMLNFEQSSLFASAGAEKITIEYFAANINLLVESDPYKDIFMDGSFLNQFKQF